MVLVGKIQNGRNHHKTCKRNLKMDMSLTGSDFAQLRAFLAVAGSLSFSRAADALGVTPSALSQMVRAFEQAVGVRLLNRTTRSVALTDAGATLYRRLAPAVADLGAALEDVGRYRERPAGTVRVHSFRSAAVLFLEPILASFAAAYPDVTLDITLDDSVAELVAGGYDAAIRIGEVIERDMVAVRLGPDIRQIAVAAPAYVERFGMPATPRELVEHRCIRWRWPGHAGTYLWEFWQNGAWFEVAVDGPLIVNDKEAALRAALDGIGIAFLSDWRIAPLVAEGALVPMLEEWSAPFPGHHLCYPRQRQMAPALRAFIDHVREHAARALTPAS
jgi:DNA-binding transcriptional LysR family regulator